MNTAHNLDVTGYLNSITFIKLTDRRHHSGVTEVIPAEVSDSLNIVSK